MGIDQLHGYHRPDQEYKRLGDLSDTIQNLMLHDEPGTLFLKLNSSAEALGMKNGAAYVYITHKIVPISKAVPALFIFRGCSNAIIK